jgi:hypothetical protein
VGAAEGGEKNSTSCFKAGLGSGGNDDQEHIGGIKDGESHDMILSCSECGRSAAAKYSPESSTCTSLSE